MNRLTNPVWLATSPHPLPLLQSIDELPHHPEISVAVEPGGEYYIDHTVIF